MIMLSKKALAIVNMLIFVFIFTILSGIILVLVSSQARDLESSIRRTKAFYVAEAGAVAALEDFRKNESTVIVPIIDIDWSYSLTTGAPIETKPAIRTAVWNTTSWELNSSCNYTAGW